MTPPSPADRWQEIDALFQRALDTPEPDRARFLEEACGGDRELHDAVKRLLRAETDGARFLETPAEVVLDLPWDEVLATAAPGVSSEPEEPDRSGERVGPYRLLSRLGRGGMATVYLAERADGLWEQQVALKVIRRGLDTEDVVQRFLAERQILSSLNHPHIARLLDGGATEDGLPFFVMEHVSGTRITEYCDAHGLGIEARLSLYCDVGRAVQFAHRNLVVHRDLKPSNILVDEEGSAKLLDFGIAKLLDEPGAEALTRTGQQLLTPDYASPEQIRGEPLTTAADVYQLGIVLCELLSGKRPYEVRALSPAQLEAQIVEAAPTAPSRLVERGASEVRGLARDRLTRRLDGDLDTIVLRALRREPEHRYGSVQALIDDIERHLAGRPILARPPTWRYRTAKLVRRNLWLAPSAAAVVILLAGYLVTVNRHSRQLETERNLARDEAERAQEVQNFLVQVFGSPNPYRPADLERGPDITVVEALDIGAERARADLAERPALRAAILGAVSDAYLSLDLTDKARPLREEALEIERDLGRETTQEFVAGLRQLGWIERLSGNPDSARTLLERGLGVARGSEAVEDTLTATLLLDESFLDSEEGEYAGAGAAATEAIGLLEGGSGEESTALRARAYARLAVAQAGLGDVAARLETAAMALELTRAAYGEDHPATALMLVEVADALDTSGRDEEAVALYREAIAALERAFGPGHAETLNARNNITTALLALGKFAEAERLLRENLELRIVAGGENHPEVARSLQNLAVMVEGQGRLDEAESLLERARAALISSLGPEHFQTAYPLLTRSGIQIKRGNYGGAEVTAREATAILRASLPEGHYATAMGECRWGRALAGQGRSAEARPLLEGAGRILERNSLVPPTYELECLGALVGMYEESGDVELAVPFRARVTELEAIVPDGS